MTTMFYLYSYPCYTIMDNKGAVIYYWRVKALGSGCSEKYSTPLKALKKNLVTLLTTQKSHHHHLECARTRNFNCLT